MLSSVRGVVAIADVNYIIVVQLWEVRCKINQELLQIATMEQGAKIKQRVNYIL
jgi:hypothetical protein